MKQTIVLLTWFLVLTKVATDKHPLHVGALFELSNHWFANYVNFFVNIIEHAFEEIGNRSDILADYSLQLIAKDTQGHNGLAARALFELMTDGPPIVAVLGPTLSPELTVVGQITPVYDVLHLSYIASTSSTVDRDLFSTMFKVNQIMDDLNPLRIKMMQYFNWRRVGTIYFQDDVNTSHMNLFHDLLKQYNMTLVTSAVVSDDNTDIRPLISRLLQYDVRIIMGSFRSTKASKIFCEAYRQGLYGRNHVWILAGPIMHADWMEDIDWTAMPCTFDELLEATNWHITLNYERVDSRNLKTIANSTPAEVEAKLRAKVAETDYRLSQSYGWVYDTAWALGVGLNNSLHYLNDSGLKDYTNNAYYLDAVMKGMHDAKFVGISGPVSFDDAGSRAGVTFIEQNFNNTRIRVAMYDQRTDTLEWFVPLSSLWPGGEIPQDRFTYQSVMVEPNLPSLVLIMIGNTLCSIVAVGFLGFNIYYRKQSNIKLSSPMINNVIIAGSILMYICVFFTTFDYGNLLPEALDNHICMVRVWIMCLGFTSLFGALFSKTWRVHILFRDYKLKKTQFTDCAGEKLVVVQTPMEKQANGSFETMTIKDWHLFSIIVFLLLFDCILLIAWSSTHSLKKESFVKNTKDLYNYNNVIAEVYTFCHHRNEGYWFVSMYIYKGLLLAFGTFLAWETRHVTVPALNDSKYIGFCIYNVVIVCIFGVPLTHVLPTEQTTLNFVLLSALVMFCTTMCLCILFIPKIRIRNKVGDRFLVPSLNTKSALSTVSASVQQQIIENERITASTVSQVPRDKESSRADSQIVTDSQNVTVDDMKNEINILRKRIAADTASMERIKQDLRQATGNVLVPGAGKEAILPRTERAFSFSESSKQETEQSNEHEPGSTTSPGHTC